MRLPRRTEVRQDPAVQTAIATHALAQTPRSPGGVPGAGCSGEQERKVHLQREYGCDAVGVPNNSPSAIAASPYATRTDPFWSGWLECRCVAKTLRPAVRSVCQLPMERSRAKTHEVFRHSWSLDKKL